MIRRAPVALFASLTLLVACSSEDAALETDGDQEVNASPECNPLRVKATDLAAPIEGLSATGNAPLPRLGPDANGFFHPPLGYTEGGTFARASDKREWAVDANSIAPAAPKGSLRVAEWNVERGNKLDQAIRLMKKENADVWLVNETDLYGKNSGGVVVAREIARALGYSYYTAIEFYERRDDRRGTSGNAIVSRFPLRDVRSLEIPIFPDKGGFDWAKSKSEPRCGQRNAISAKIDAVAADGTIRATNVVALHTENKTSASVRRAQFDHVVRSLVTPGEPTILAGDLNTLAPAEGTSFRGDLARLVTKNGRERALFDCSRGDDTTTFSAALIINARIDWMMVQSGDGVHLDCPAGGYQVHSNDGSSDHRPVIVQMTVR